MGKKTIDFKTRRVASRGRKSKAGGGKVIKGSGTIYTPGNFSREHSLKSNLLQLFYNIFFKNVACLAVAMEHHRVVTH